MKQLKIATFAGRGNRIFDSIVGNVDTKLWKSYSHSVIMGRVLKTLESTSLKQKPITQKIARNHYLCDH